MSDMVYFYFPLWSDFKRGRFYWEHCDSGGLSCPLRLSARSISDLLNREGKEKGCLKNEESNMAGEEFSPLPSGYVRVRIRACTCEYVGRCDYSGAAVTQGWGANPAVHIWYTFQIKLKFPWLCFHFSPWLTLAGGGSWFLSGYSLLMCSW